MQTPPPRVFGRRQIGGGLRPPTAAPSRPLPDLLTIEAEEAGARAADPTERRVPRARRAAFLAGAVVGCVDVGLALRYGGDTPQLKAALQAAGFEHAGVLPRVANGVVAGLQGAASSLFVVRAVLNAMRLTAPLDYAVAGAVFAALSSYLMQQVGSEPSQSPAWAAIAAGGATGFLFRVFAGVVTR